MCGPEMANHFYFGKLELGPHKNLATRVGLAPIGYYMSPGLYSRI